MKVSVVQKLITGMKNLARKFFASTSPFGHACLSRNGDDVPTTAQGEEVQSSKMTRMLEDLL